MLGILCKKKHVTLLLQILMFWYTQKNIGYTFSCNIARLEKDTIFFLVRLLVWKWTYVILTHSKMTTFLSATNSKRKKDFVKISFSRPLFLPFQFPYHNLWTHGETQKFSSVPITWSRMRKKIGLSCSEISSLGCIQIWIFPTLEFLVHKIKE